MSFLLFLMQIDTDTFVHWPRMVQVCVNVNGRDDSGYLCNSHSSKVHITTPTLPPPVTSPTARSSVFWSVRRTCSVFHAHCAGFPSTEQCAVVHWSSARFVRCGFGCIDRPRTQKWPWIGDEPHTLTEQSKYANISSEE